MRIGNPIEQVAAAFYSAIIKDLPSVDYESYLSIEQRKNKEKGVIKQRRPFDSEVTCVVFPQTWGSTALGFGGMGGAAMTPAYTTIVSCDKYAAVYFGTGFAYLVEITAEFSKDVIDNRMVEVSRAASRYAVLKTFRENER